MPPSNRYRRRRFAIEYAAVPNGTRAALAAGYAPSSAAVQAHRLLQHPEVVAIIANERRKAAEQLGLHARATLADALAGGVAALSEYWTLDVLPQHHLDEPARTALRLRRREELSDRALRTLAPESFDQFGCLVAIVLVDPVPAIVELGRRAGVPGFDDQETAGEAAEPSGDLSARWAHPTPPSAPRRRCDTTADPFE